MIGLAIILFLGVLSWDLASDYAKWKSGVDVRHTWEAILRAGFLLPSVFFLAGFTFKKVPEKWLLCLLAAAFVEASVWWLFFDGIYNSLRGFGWWFNGGVDYNDGWLDKFLMKMEDWQEALLKIGLVMGSVYLLIKVRK